MIKAPEETTIGIQVIEVPAHWVNDGEKRLDAGFYAQDVIKARVLLDKVSKSITIMPLKKLINEIFMPALKVTIPFSEEGEDYLTQSEVEFLLPRSRKKVDIRKIENPDRWRVKRGYILISQSGTIGRITICTKYLEKFVISPNPIRIIADESIRGFLYAFFLSWIGQALVKSPKYGITVKHILPHHLENLPIPRIPKVEKEINQRMLEAHKLRESAQEELLKAEEMIYTELGLPKIDEDDVEYFGGELGKIIKAFKVKASEIDDTFRLDASYYVPVLRSIKKNLKLGEIKGYFQLKRLGDDIAEVFDLSTYKRIYVKPENGYPILSGVHLRQIRLYDLKYISGLSFVKNGKSYLDKYKIKKGRPLKNSVFFWNASPGQIFGNK